MEQNGGERKKTLERRDATRSSAGRLEMETELEETPKLCDLGANEVLCKDWWEGFDPKNEGLGWGKEDDMVKEQAAMAAGYPKWLWAEELWLA